MPAAPPGFDWINPDYGAVFNERMRRLNWIRENPDVLPGLKLYYRDNPDDFISDWGVTFDPRNAERGLPTIIPMVLFRKQREFIRAVVAHWKAQKPLLVEKSRDAGVSYCAVQLGCTLCLFNDEISIGFGSRKEEYVDKIGQPKSLFWKARLFLEWLPPEFLGGWVAWRDAPHMRIHFPHTGSVITGEAGSNIGRGDRAAIYMVDESAWLEQPMLVEHALSQTTNCRIDMSSVNGMNNPFARKRWGGKVDVFIFDWRDDPRKNDAWYAKQCAELDPVTVAQEIDRDYQASVTGTVIPAAWVRAAVGAREKLGLSRAGMPGISFDVADEGQDANATCRSHGIEVLDVKEWSGKGGDIFASTERVFGECDEHGLTAFDYDADGLGADVRGDARVINDRRRVTKRREVSAIPFRGSGEVIDPDGQVFGSNSQNDLPGRTNQDYFQNRKAQGWWDLRIRFQRTYRWVVDRVPCAPDDIISLDPGMQNLRRLEAELSQPTFKESALGKIMVQKAPAGMKSPNMADAVMMRFARRPPGAMRITADILAQIARHPKRGG